jgi:hypothetical protein
MAGRIVINVLDRDPDYLGIDINARSERFSGSARIYAGLESMAELANVISGFPKTSHDERHYQFGNEEPGFAGGFCSLRFHCIDGVGHTRVEVILNDDDSHHEQASARFTIPVSAAGIDRFVAMLWQVDKDLLNQAELS